ncbi:MAG: LamG-like jellyroll fold domain-containing protein, partial [Planctomycetota bacterium]
MCKKLIFLTSFLLVLGMVSNTMAQIDPATVETGHVYLLEDVNDGAVSDDSANDNAGNIVGDPNLVDGINGKALLFDGIDDGVHIPDSEFINVTGGPFPNRTVTAVFNCADVTKLEKQTVFEEGGLTRGLTIYVFDGQVYVGGWNKAEYQWNPGSWMSVPINSNQWYTVSLVIRNGADAQQDYKFEMWVDGNFISMAPGGQIYNHANDNGIGYTKQNNVFHDGDASGNGWYFEGMIDEVWILNEAVGELPFANTPTPANDEVDVKAAPTLSWAAPDDAFQHDLYFGTDADLVAAGDPSVSMGSLAEASYAVDPNFPLSRGTTYYWKVDVTTGSARKSELQPGNLWSFRVADENTASWLAAATEDGPAYLDTFVEAGPYDIGALGGEITYEFVILGNPDEQEASMALIGNGVPNALGEYTHLAFVSSETSNTTALYVNGALAGSIDSVITLSGIVGIGQAIQDPNGVNFIDPFDGTIFGVAIYDEALADEMIAAHADAYFNPVTEIIPVNPGTEGLVAYYNFENDANDSSGNENHGALVGDPVFVNGPTGYGTALEFNGDDYVDCGNGDTLQIQDAITMSFWFKVVAFENTWEAMLSKGDTAYRVSRGPGDGDATHMGISGTTGGGGSGWFNGATIITGGQWHHFAGTYDGAEGRIYIDGVLDATTEATGQINIETENFWIGNNSQNVDRFFHGVMDEVMLYNRALSDLEVMYLAGKRAVPVDPGADGMVAFFPLENDVLDASGNGNDGTIVGDPVFVDGPAGYGMAMEFDGDDHVDTGNLEDLAEWTIACWAKSPLAPSGDSPSGPVHREQNYQINWNHGDENFRASVTVSAGGWHPASLGTLEADTWYYIAGSYDGETLKSYVDGDLITVNE